MYTHSNLVKYQTYNTDLYHEQQHVYTGRTYLYFLGRQNIRRYIMLYYIDDNFTIFSHNLNHHHILDKHIRIQT